MPQNLIIEGLKAEIDNGLSNTIGYNFFKTVFANNQQIKKDRAKEFLEFMTENQQYFVSELINNECFVSGLSLTLQTVIEQYSEFKRLKIYNIFLGFATSKDKENFELEKMYHTLNLLSLEDLKELQKYDEKTTPILKNITSLISTGILYDPNLWGNSNFYYTSFGKKFKQYVFQDLK